MVTEAASITSNELNLNYERFEGRYDEARSEDGAPREHWEYFFNALQTLGRSGLTDRQIKATRLLRDDGANYSRTADARSVRPWGLDPVPLLLDSESWAQAEIGLSERSELFDLLLRDLYSERAILRSGVLPAELVLNHPGFLRCCAGITPPADQQLVLHAVNLARTPKGQFQVLSDRTQAPSGSGYALLNRTVMSRILPSLIRDSQVHRLAVFFQSLRRQLASLSGQSDPRIVLLTPGAFSETYFEHSYLANYLGYSLVQGSDLVVKDGFVWMRSLEGLHRVDVILRRLDDVWCDPVELRGDSQLGVPGLLEVIRAGNVKLANPLGSGILENPALLRYIDEISNFYLGRTLRLPSVKTWWLGDLGDRKYVLANIDKLIIKPVTRSAKSGSIYGPGLNSEEIEQLKNRILTAPGQFVAQIANLPSAAPSWQRGQIQSLPSILRTFAVADQGSYKIMAGGLTRTAARDDQSIVSNQLGATSKDTWVLASEPQAQITLLTDGATNVHINVAANTDLPSRVVENLFWMGRYAERAESLARLMRTLILQLNAVVPMPLNVRDRLLKGFTDISSSYPGFYTADELGSPMQEIDKLLTHIDFVGSLPSNLQSMLNCTEEVREMLSADTHRVLSDLREQVFALPQLNTEHDLVGSEEALDSLITSLMALNGLTQESMIRGLGWRFLEIGRRIERLLQTSTLLRTTLVPVLTPDEEEQLLECLMLSSETLNAYRRRYPKGAKLTTALPVMMLDGTNPRSVIYQLNTLDAHLKELAEPAKAQVLSLPQRSLLHARSEVRLSYAEELATLEDDGRRQKLDDLLAFVNGQIAQCAQQIGDAHFEQARTPQQLVMTTAGDQ